MISDNGNAVAMVRDGQAWMLSLAIRGWRKLLKQDLEPDVRRGVEWLINGAQARLLEPTSNSDQKNLDEIIRDLECWRDLLRQDPEPDARRELERLIRQAEERLREIEHK